MSSVLRCILGSLLIFAASTAQGEGGSKPEDRPFGLTEGMSQADLSKSVGGFKSTNDDFMFEATTVPHPVKFFDSYVFQSTDETGLCRVVGVTPSIGSNRKLEEDYTVLLSSLTEKYGRPKSLDRAQPYMDNAPLISALATEMRRKAQVWSLRHSPGIKTIVIEAFGDDAMQGYITVKYEFSNVTKCLEIINQKATQGL